MACMSSHDLFTPRQLTALTTFSNLVHEARELATQDALAATPLGPPNALGGGLAADDDVPLREGGRGSARIRRGGECVFALSLVDRTLADRHIFVMSMCDTPE